MSRGLNSIVTPAEFILQFLQDGLKKGLCPATLRRQVATLDSIFSLQSPAASLTCHSLVQKFLMGALLLHPLQHNKFPMWSLHTFLRALMGPPFEPMKVVDLKWVRLKTIFLVAITSACRVSELGALLCRSDLCIFHHDTVFMRMDPSTFRPKIESRFHMDLEISLPSFCPRPQHPQE